MRIHSNRRVWIAYRSLGCVIWALCGSFALTDSSRPFLHVYESGPLYSDSSMASASPDGRGIWLNMLAATYEIAYPGLEVFRDLKEEQPLLAITCRSGPVDPSPVRVHLVLPMSPQEPDVPNFFSVAYWWRVWTDRAYSTHDAVVVIDGESYASELNVPHVDYSFPRPERMLELPARFVLEKLAVGDVFEMRLTGPGADAELRFESIHDAVEQRISAQMLIDCLFDDED